MVQTRRVETSDHHKPSPPHEAAHELSESAGIEKEEMRIVEGTSSKNTDCKAEAGCETVKQRKIGGPLPGLEAADQGD